MCPKATIPRVIPNFMIQGGGFTADMKQKPTGTRVKNEADNGLKNLRGTIAVARTMVIDSATAQFFINLKDNGFLNHSDKTMKGYGYAAMQRHPANMPHQNPLDIHGCFSYRHFT